MTCICCQGDLTPLRYRDEFLNNPLQECRNCGHIQLQKNPDARKISEYYASRYAENRNSFVGPAYFRVMEKRAAAQWQLLEKYAKPGPGSNLCDVGCGFGFFLKHVKGKISTAYGLEYDTTCIEYCEKQGLDVRKLNSEAEMQFENPVDLVVMSHLVEHLNEIRETLSNIKKRSKIVFIEVPNYNPGIDTQFSDQEGHINFFNRKSLTLLLQSLGFEILYITNAGPSMNTFWRDEMVYNFTRKIRRKLSGDFFYNEYDKEATDGIWIRAIVKTNT